MFCNNWKNLSEETCNPFEYCCIATEINTNNYLGVILDPCLTWNEHIEYSGNKISSHLGMIGRARKVIPKEACMITLFNAMVLPFFDYCCCVWDGWGQGNKNYLDRLLKRAAGIIASRKATDTDIQQTLKWPSLQCCREY